MFFGRFVTSFQFFRFFPAPAAVMMPAAIIASVIITPAIITPFPPVTGEVGMADAVGAGELVTVQKMNGEGEG